MNEVTSNLSPALITMLVVALSCLSVIFCVYMTHIMHVLCTKSVIQKFKEENLNKVNIQLDFKINNEELHIVLDLLKEGTELEYDDKSFILGALEHLQLLQKRINLLSNNQFFHAIEIKKIVLSGEQFQSN